MRRGACAWTRTLQWGGGGFRAHADEGGDGKGLGSNPLLLAGGGRPALERAFELLLGRFRLSLEQVLGLGARRRLGGFGRGALEVPERPRDLVAHGEVLDAHLVERE